MNDEETTNGEEEQEQAVPYQASPEPAPTSTPDNPPQPPQPDDEEADEEDTEE